MIKNAFLCNIIERVWCYLFSSIDHRLGNNCFQRISSTFSRCPLISIHCLEHGETLQSGWLTHIQGPSNDYSRPSAKIAYVSWPGGYPPIIADLVRIRRADGVYKFFGGEALNHEPRPPLSATPSLEIHRELENRRVAMRYLGEARWFIWWPIFRVDRLRCPSIENFEPCIFIPFPFLFFLFFSLPPSRIIF